uniref:Solute carrier family 2 member 11a n=1 Tax=Salmo trutta TaxID=8032 RepID=A0A674DN46_SALTR
VFLLPRLRLSLSFCSPVSVSLPRPPSLMTCGPAIIKFVTLLFFPEAPRYLYIDKGDTEGSKKVLQWLWQEDDLKMEMDDMEKERESMWQVLALVIPCACVQFCGINAIYFYAFNIFRESGVAEDKMHYLSIGIGATELISISLCSLLIDRAGRKILMGYGYLLLGVIMSILVSFLSQQDLFSWVPYVNITLIFSVICVYGLRPSGVSMALPADLFLQAWRPSAYVISGSVNWLGLFLIGMFFPYIVDALGQFCFLVFVAYCMFIPETKGKSMVEIMEDFNKLHYKNRGTDTEKADFVLETTF